MSIAEVHYMPATSQRPLVPPQPPRASEDMTFLQRMRTMRVSAIATWGQRAYEEDVIEGSFFATQFYADVDGHPDVDRTLQDRFRWCRSCCG